MKMKVAIIIGLPLPGTPCTTDSMAQSRLLAQGQWYGGPNAEFSMPAWTVGEEFALDIPSGMFKGIVHNVDEYGEAESQKARDVASVFGGPQPAPTGVRLFVEGEWDGKERGLVSGLCAFGTFRAHVERGIVVESTLLPKGKEVRYPDYSWAKQARGLLQIGDDGARALL